MTSSQHGSDVLGDTHATMVGNNELPTREGELSHKPARGSDRSLQPDCVKAESLVTAGQHTAVNTFPDPTQLVRHVPSVHPARRRWPDGPGPTGTRGSRRGRGRAIGTKP